MKKLLAFVCLAFALNACGNAPSVPNGVKVGKPYTVSGETYYPEYDPHYDKIGMASWYGPGFHGGKTANGERFDQDDLTAASPTLPMPSIVRVTNLSTGESAIVRINDRGPFKDHRLIDLSHASAKRLGITGLQKVRVEYLKDETESYWAKMDLKTDDIAFARNDPYAPQNETIAPPPLEEDAVVKSAAPVTSVTEADLKPENMKIRPIQPQFRVIDDAQAAPTVADPPVQARKTALQEDTEDDAGDKADAPPAQDRPEVVRLVDRDGHNVEGDAPQTAHIVHVEQTASAEPPEADAASEEDTEEQNPPQAAQVVHLQHLAKADPLPPPPSAEPEPGKWFIQAGAFASEENARHLADRLGNLAGVDVKPIDVGGKTLHRVRVGPFDDAASAAKALDKATAEGAIGARIVQD